MEGTDVYDDLGPGKHLVLDQHTIADRYRLRRRVHEPKREAGGPVLTVEKPWEGDSLSVNSVMYDADRGRYRMWYNVLDSVVSDERWSKHPDSLEGNIGEPQPGYLCYAESEDGVHWDRPGLGIYEHEAGANNICFKGYSFVQGCSVCYRPDAPADERYVLVNLDWFSVTSGGVSLAYSSDGIHWAYREERPVIFGESDTLNNMVFNAERGVHMLYMRGWHSAAIGWIGDWVGGPGRPMSRKADDRDLNLRRRHASEHPDQPRLEYLVKYGSIKNERRRVTYSESRDLKEWSEPQIIISPDELDVSDLYGMCVFRYGDYYLGQLWVHDDDEWETIEMELAFSRDGVAWSRLPDRPTFIRRGAPGEADGFMVLSAQAPVVVGDDIYVYWTGHDRPHDAGNWLDGAPAGLENGGKPVVCRGRLRMDGFVSLRADRRLGALVTRPFVLESDRILINAAAYGGEIFAELTEPDAEDVRGKAVAGLGADDFDVFRGDDIGHALSWGGRSDLSALKGRRLMLRMSMYHTDLFSFTL
ncbi:MAG: hypothetical protein CMJ49_05775 [Planctomycetaceae bacterium]|nr:hypothetical protein [Planctomycetaceae bacterium]